MLVSCRNAVLEKRGPCPSLLYFDIFNAGAFGNPDRVCIHAYRYPDRSSLACDTTTIRALTDKDFFLNIRQADAVRGSGVLGFRNSRAPDGIHWTVPPGSQFDSLFRFSYLSIVEPELFTVPVEFVKEFCCISIQFVNAQFWNKEKNVFPYDVAIRSGTCGVDVLTGKPVEGAFNCWAQEPERGLFRCILPRQGDEDLLMELYSREDASEIREPAHSFNLGGILAELGGITWREKNLPDILVGIDFKDSDFQVQVMPWEYKDINYEY